MTSPSNTDRFSQPAINDETGHCIHCGRDNRGEEGAPCSNECPMYWEEIGIRNPEYPDSFARADQRAAEILSAQVPA